MIHTYPDQLCYCIFWMVQDFTLLPEDQLQTCPLHYPGSFSSWGGLKVCSPQRLNQPSGSLYGSALAPLHMLWLCSLLSYGTPNSGRRGSLWLFCLHLGLFPSYWVTPSSLVYLVGIYLLLLQLDTQCLIYSWEDCPFLKGNRQGVDLGERQGSRERLEGENGRETMVVVNIWEKIVKKK